MITFSPAKKIIMLVSQHIFRSYKHRTVQAVNLLQRFQSSTRIPSRCYSSSSRQKHRRPDGTSLFHVKAEASRSRASYAFPVAVLGFVGFSGLVAFIHFNDERRVASEVKRNSRVGNTNFNGTAIHPFALINTENKITTEKDFLGNWVLLYFGYTFSPDVGPEQLQMMAKAIDKLESKDGVKVLPVFITIDPYRDTPSHLRAYLKEFDSRIMGLTGPVNSIRQMAQENRVFFKKVEEDQNDYLIETSHKMYLLNPKMEVVGVYGVQYTADELSKAILSEVSSISK